MPRARKQEMQFQRLALIGLVIVVAYLAWDKFRTEQRLSNPEYLVELANGLQQDSDTGRHAQMILETRALAEDEFHQLRSLADEATSTLDSCESETATLAALLEQLRSTSKGRAIAVDRDALEQFHTATKDFAVTPETVREHRRALSTLRQPIDAALTQASFDKPPAPELRSKLETLAETIRETAESLQVTHRKVQAIAAEAPSDVPNGGTSLDQALTQLEQEWAALDAAAAQQATRSVREEFREKFAAQQALQAREKLQAELEQKKLVHDQRLAAEQAAAEAEANRLADAAEEARQAEARRTAAREQRLKEEAAEREYQAALPDIERYLSGFTTPGHKQLVRGRWVYTEEMKPISLGELKARRCLEASNTGYMSLGGYAGSDANDRPAGQLSGYNGAGHVPQSLIPEIAKAQGLLRKYGDQLVAHGKLLP